jgi:hypothetical protein
MKHANGERRLPSSQANSAIERPFSHDRKRIQASSDSDGRRKVVTKVTIQRQFSLRYLQNPKAAFEPDVIHLL